MAHKAENGSGSGYPHFTDGPALTGDSVYSGSDGVTSVDVAVSQVKHPIPIEVEGQLFENGAGSLIKMNEAGMSATRACQMTIAGAQMRINMGHSIQEVMVEVAARAKRALVDNAGTFGKTACELFCLKAFSGQCPFQVGGIDPLRSTGQVTLFTEESFADLIGLVPATSKRRSSPEGQKVFDYLLDHGLGRNNGFTPIPVPLDGVDSNLAQAHLFKWKAKHRDQSPPVIETAGKLSANPKLEEQLRLDLEA
jgi:hypothetical protein